MDTIVRDVTPITLLSASYEHFVAYELYCAGNPNGKIFETPEFTLAISGTASPYLNCVVRSQLSPKSNLDGCIESVFDHARLRSLRMTWFILPGTTPGDLGPKLQAHGLKYIGEEPGMAIGLEIVEVLDLATLEEWVSVWGDSYEADEAKRRGRLSFGGHLPCISKLC